MTARTPGAGSRAGGPAVPLIALAGVVLVPLNLRTAVTSISPLLGETDAELGLGPGGRSLLGRNATAMLAVWGGLTPLVARRDRRQTANASAVTPAAAGHV